MEGKREMKGLNRSSFSTLSLWVNTTTCLSTILVLFSGERGAGPGNARVPQLDFFVVSDGVRQRSVPD